MRKLLIAALDRCELRDAAGQPLRYTARDFRRLFASDAVNAGLPIHIVARILGRANINTTQSYTAVFDDDLVRAYRAFLDQRRSERPAPNTANPPTRNGARSNGSSRNANSDLAHADAPTGPVANTSTRACGARACDLTRPPGLASSV